MRSCFVGWDERSETHHRREMGFAIARRKTRVNALMAQPILRSECSAEWPVVQGAQPWLEPGETPVMIGLNKIKYGAREAFAMTATVDVLAQAFKESGTPFMVGHPGGESVELMEAARQRQMRFLLMKQEVAGAMLAATWGDITGSPGICMSTRGPGAANMVNGVAHAFLDRSPLIAITDSYSRPTYE